jgi:hypothetical protein
MITVTGQIPTIHLAALCARFYPDDLAMHPDFDPELIWIRKPHDDDKVRIDLSAGAPKTIIVNDEAWVGHLPHNVHLLEDVKLDRATLTFKIQPRKYLPTYDREFTIEFDDADVRAAEIQAVFCSLSFRMTPGTMSITGGEPRHQGMIITTMQSNPPKWRINQPDLRAVIPANRLAIAMRNLLGLDDPSSRLAGLIDPSLVYLPCDPQDLCKKEVSGEHQQLLLLSEHEGAAMRWLEGYPVEDVVSCSFNFMDVTGFITGDYPRGQVKLNRRADGDFDLVVTDLVGSQARDLSSFPAELTKVA